VVWETYLTSIAGSAIVKINGHRKEDPGPPPCLRSLGLGTEVSQELTYYAPWPSTSSHGKKISRLTSVATAWQKSPPCQVRDSHKKAPSRSRSTVACSSSDDPAHRREGSRAAPSPFAATMQRLALALIFSLAQPVNWRMGARVRGASYGTVFVRSNSTTSRSIKMDGAHCIGSV
jgi:hypothetical protein